MGKVGRPRTTSCAVEHLGAPCKVCARERQRRRRRQHPEIVRVADRARCDERRRAEVRARAYVREYLKRGAIYPPEGCEGCLAIGRLEPFHPDPEKKRMVAWLCQSCRKRVSATREPLTLTWEWPGRRPERGGRRLGSFSLHPSWLPAAQATYERAVAEVGKPGSQVNRALLYLGGFWKVVGQAEREALYAASLQHRGGDWAPYGEPRLDGLLRWWAKREVERRGREARLASVERQGVVVTPVPARERKEKKRLQIPADHQDTSISTAAREEDRAARPRITPAQLEELLDEAFEEVDAVLARVTQRLGTD